MCLCFSVDELFRIKDTKTPIGVEHAIRGLLNPFESLFPNSCVPSSEQEALEFITTPDKYSPTQPFDPEMKRDWIFVLWCEVQMRLAVAFRFMKFLSRIDKKRRWWRKPRPIILFLREFREVKYEANLGMHIATSFESDLWLRAKVEKMFPKYPVLWVANPRDDLSRSFMDSDFLNRINNNSVPYIVSEDWLRWVRVLAEASDLIVMSNTKADGGVGQEVAMLVECGLVDSTFFSNPDRVPLRSGRLNSVDDLTPITIRVADVTRHRKILDLPLMRHWAGAESMEYSRHYIAAVNNCAGNLHDLGGSVSHEVFAAVFMALVALLIFRGELKAAAKFQRRIAFALLGQADRFHPYDVVAASVLLESAKWYDAYGYNYSMAHLLKFDAPP
jgi:hypothetical protein